MASSTDVHIESMDLFASSSDTSSQVSSLYTLLPSTVKSRIPRLPSLRRSSVRPGSAPSTIPIRNSSYTSQPTDALPLERPRSVADFYSAHPQAAELIAQDPYLALPCSSRPDSPMPALTMAASIASSRPETPSDEDMLSGQQRASISQPPSSRPSSQQHLYPSDPQRYQLGLHTSIQPPATTTREDLAATMPALTLLTTAHYTATSAPELARPLILDATLYLLRALPKDLDSRELANLQSVLPAQISLTPSDPTPHPTVSNTSGRWTLRSLISTLLTQTILLLSLILPYFAAAARALWALERRHRVSERLLAWAMGVVAACCDDDAAALRDVVARLARSRLGACVGEVGVWVWDGVVGGVGDGVGEGWRRVVGERLAGQEREGGQKSADGKREWERERMRI